MNNARTAALHAICIALIFLLAAPNGFSQVTPPKQLPPGPEYVGQQVDAISASASDTISGLDPTQGMLPTPDSIRNEAAIKAAASKLGAFKGEVASGQINYVPMDQMPADDPLIQEGALPTTLYYHTASWADLGLPVPDVVPTPPSTPTTPQGPSSGAPNVAYTYSTQSTDGDADQIQILFDWGDGTTTWTAMAASGATASASHAWSSAGTYAVRATAKDSAGTLSAPSNALTVSISSSGGGGGGGHCPATSSTEASGGNVATANAGQSTNAGNAVGSPSPVCVGVRTGVDRQSSAAAGPSNAAAAPVSASSVTSSASTALSNAPSVFSNLPDTSLSPAERMQRVERKRALDQQLIDFNVPRPLAPAGAPIAAPLGLTANLTQAPDDPAWREPQQYVPLTGTVHSNVDGQTLFQDNFDESSLDTGKWTVLNAGYGIQMASSSLRVTVQEQGSKFAEIRGSAVSSTFDSSHGVDASMSMARHVAGDGWVNRPEFRLQRSDASTTWVGIQYDTWGGNVNLKDSSGASTVLASPGQGNPTGYHTVRIVLTGTGYTGYFDSNSASVTSSLFNGAPGFRVDLQDNTGGSTSGATDTTARQYLFVYAWTTGSSGSPPNTPATPSGPTSGSPSSTYAFSSSSSDPANQNVQLEFDWGDGSSSWTAWGSSGSTLSATHAWSGSGTYYVRALAQNTGGYTSGWSSSHPITISSSQVAPSTPTTPSGPTSVTQGISYSYSTHSTDGNGDQVRITFDWGDGTTTTTAYASSGATLSASHAWSSTGTYYVRAYAMDTAGYSSSWSGNLAVSVTSNQSPSTPTQPSGPSTGQVGSSYSFTTSSNDPQGESIRYLFDWGDGTQSWSGSYASGSLVGMSHSWQAAGTYNVKAMAQDSYGSQSSWSSAATIVISSGAPPSSGTTFSESFDGASQGGCPSGWSCTGLWHASNMRSYSAPLALWYGQESTADYCVSCSGGSGATNAGSATTPVIQVPTTHPSAIFHDYYSTEQTSGYDRMHVSVLSTSGQDLYDFPDLVGTQGTWNTETYDLTSWSGTSIKLQFTFNTVDGLYNNFEGWHVDDVSVVGNNNQPSGGTTTVTMSSTDWYHQTVSGSNTQWFHQDDGSVESSANVLTGSDHFTKRLYIHEAQGSASSFQLWFYAHATGCSNGGSYSHSLTINQGQYVFNPCSWSTSQFGWGYFDLPGNLLVDGFNTFTVGIANANGNGFTIGLDTDTGADTQTTINGQPLNGEALVWVAVGTQGANYDEITRWLKYDSTDQNGKTQTSYGEENYIYFSPSSRDMLFVRFGEDPSGVQHSLWGYTRFDQNNYYNAQTKYSGVNHFVTADDGTFVAPTTGAYYTWFHQEWGSHDDPDSANQDAGGDQQGTYEHLVPSQPEQSSDYVQGAQNPPKGGSNNDPVAYKFTLSLYMHTIDSNPCGSNYGIQCWQGHVHKEFEFALHILDLSQDFKDYSTMAQVVQQSIQMDKDFIDAQANMAQFLKLEMKFNLVGFMISWAFDIIQTGDFVKLKDTEKDLVRYPVRFHYTSLDSVPSVGFGIGKLSIKPYAPYQFFQASPNFDFSHTCSFDRDYFQTGHYNCVHT